MKIHHGFSRHFGGSVSRQFHKTLNLSPVAVFFIFLLIGGLILLGIFLFNKNLNPADYNSAILRGSIRSYTVPQINVKEPFVKTKSLNNTSPGLPDPTGGYTALPDPTGGYTALPDPTGG